ncbi:MAG: SDR family NAD(P)-dependent oxidoreductase [Candidatus Diapherotrites archaeon]|nr:SDR family NAD(P)-dependent oxidoreductase [Candidatus Diapherotrites archaeon]
MLKEEFMQEKIVVTGGAGFIGSFLCEKLVEQGFDVTVLDNLSTGKPENLEKIKDKIRFVQADITVREQIDPVFSGARYVFHLAALSYVGESVQRPSDYNRINIDGTLNVLQAAKAQGVQRVIFPSTCIVYGDTSSVPVPETEPLNPNTPYGFTKAAGEWYCRMFNDLHGLQTVCVRIFNAYGPRMRQRVISKFALRMLNGESPLVNGNGKQKRDLIYVSDIVDGLLCGLKISPQQCGKTYNIGTGTSHRLTEVVDAINSELGTHTPIEFRPAVAGEAEEMTASTKTAEKVLGFKAKVGLREGIHQTMEWFRQHPNRN